MKVYYGGQINKEDRGDLALLVGENPETKGVSASLYHFLEPEVFSLTGERSVSYPLERIYLHISHQAGEKLIREIADRPFREIDFDRLDELVVINFFLNNNPERPKEIILRATRTGYEVVEPK